MHLCVVCFGTNMVVLSTFKMSCFRGCVFRVPSDKHEWKPSPSRNCAITVGCLDRVDRLERFWRSFSYGVSVDHMHIRASPPACTLVCTHDLHGGPSRTDTQHRHDGVIVGGGRFAVGPDVLSLGGFRYHHRFPLTMTAVLVFYMGKTHLFVVVGFGMMLDARRGRFATRGR